MGRVLGWTKGKNFFAVLELGGISGENGQQDLAVGRGVSSKGES